MDIIMIIVLNLGSHNLVLYIIIGHHAARGDFTFSQVAQVSENLTMYRCSNPLYCCIVH